MKTFTRFKDTAYCGRFRSDGQLLVAGCEDSVVRLFDVNGRVALRKFTGHTKWVFSAFQYYWLGQMCSTSALKEELYDDFLSDPSTELSDDLKNSDNL